jgi:hypothetical protein
LTFTEVIDPNTKDKHKYGFKDIFARDPSNKVILPLIAPALEEAESMDLILPSIVDLIVHKANHYLAHINPSIQNTYKNFLGNDDLYVT